MNSETISTAELIACVEREIKLRQQVYPNRVLTRRMRQKTADRQIAMMRQILEILREIEKAEMLPVF
jgi:hypothetical protein